MPPPAAGSEGRGTSARRQSTAWCTHTGSSSREPIPEDDESNEDEDPASPQSESSQSGDDAEDGSGSDSGSSADGDGFEAMPRKGQRGPLVLEMAGADPDASLLVPLLFA